MTCFHSPISFNNSLIFNINARKNLSCLNRQKRFYLWLRGPDLNQRPPGYEPDELPTALPRDIILLNWCRRPGSNRYAQKGHGILSPGRLPIPPLRQKLAPRVGLEPTTYRLTAECSTIELPWNIAHLQAGKYYIITAPLLCQQQIWRKFIF